MKRIEGPAPAIGPYSPGVAAGGLLFVSGQLPVNAEGQLVPGVEAQARQCIENVKAILEAGGSDLDHVVKTTVFLRSINDFAVFNEVYAQYFKGEVLPARSCVQVAALPKNAPMEMEAIGQIWKE